MQGQRDWREAVDAIKQLERRDAPTSLEERVARLAIVCRTAAQLQRQFPNAPKEAQRGPWPESTLTFLREHTKAVYGE